MGMSLPAPAAFGAELAHDNSTVPSTEGIFLLAETPKKNCSAVLRSLNVMWVVLGSL